MKYLGFGVFRNINLSFHPRDQLPDHWTIWKAEDEIGRALASAYVGVLIHKIE